MTAYEENMRWERDDKPYCALVAQDKSIRAYVRQDGCLNLLFYDSTYERETERHTYDWHICEIDEAIGLLQNLKKEAVAYFAEKGIAWPPD